MDGWARGHGRTAEMAVFAWAVVLAVTMLTGACLLLGWKALEHHGLLMRAERRLLQAVPSDDAHRESGAQRDVEILTRRLRRTRAGFLVLASLTVVAAVWSPQLIR